MKSKRSWRLGVKKHPRPKRGDIDAYVELPKAGLVLNFELPETGKSSVLPLNEVQFYAGLPMQGSGRFPGALPDGLVFEDSQETSRQRPGAPDHALEGIDVWKRGAHEMTREYRRDRSSVALLHLGVPVRA